MSTVYCAVNVQSNFLHGFSTLSPHKTKKSKAGTSQLDGLWLSLFVNLSFSSEGQTMILKIDGMQCNPLKLHTA